MDHSIIVIKQTKIDTLKIKNDLFKIKLIKSSMTERNTLVIETLNSNVTFKVQVKKCNMR